MWYLIVSIPDLCTITYLLNIDNPYFEQMVGQIYPTELQLNKANSSDTEAPFLDLFVLVPVKCIQAPQWLRLLSVLRRWFCCC